MTPTPTPATNTDRPEVSMTRKRPHGVPGGPESVTGSAEDRIRTFVDTEHRRVVATVSLWTGSFDDAADAVTDALGRAWEQLDRGRRIDNLAAWVTHAAMNQIRSTRRRSKVAGRKRHLVAVVDVTDDPNRERAAHLDLRRALEQLTARQREVVALYYGLDLAVPDIGASLGIAPGTVKATLHQARERLADLLDQPTGPAAHRPRPATHSDGSNR